MHFSWVVSLTFVSACLAIPLSEGGLHASFQKRTVTPDATCGGSKGYTCLGSTFGNCCSANGWCGATTAYCDAGSCQTKYGSCTGSTTSKPSSTPTPMPSSTLADCLAAKNVPVRFSSSSDFSSLAKPYNLRLAYTPAVIVLPTTTKHVSDSVVCASKCNVKVQAKSGGHSYASYSSGGQSGSMVIDLENFNSVTVDATTGVAQVGGGVRLGNMALALYNQGQRALPHGTCPGESNPMSDKNIQ